MYLLFFVILFSYRFFFVESVNKGFIFEKNVDFSVDVNMFVFKNYTGIDRKVKSSTLKR